ncbi:uncharacterized protein MICPUCDRAFT_65837 [Micromonas pusilla CCMP1545]|uniref:Predicted protein n=1 Tax=Micromonas pusilla (strain CCMP1545) TaxID=564608 RepID=C1N707_MICPC|nr:uncharacterized protein MICPUCDRAFT_65837 [Micromonas pusilla CCMP1545]EEH52196.1 predicted protein [Micromonas pusilla CCMP1545]|eukprot:XP_003063823.1 predicted protein [Micromonas pusilla CCMP1545]
MIRRRLHRGGDRSHLHRGCGHHGGVALALVVLPAHERRVRLPPGGGRRARGRGRGRGRLRPRRRRHVGRRHGFRRELEEIRRRRRRRRRHLARHRVRGVRRGCLARDVAPPHERLPRRLRRPHDVQIRVELRQLPRGLGASRRVDPPPERVARRRRRRRAKPARVHHVRDGARAPLGERPRAPPRERGDERVTRASFVTRCRLRRRRVGASPRLDVDDGGPLSKRPPRQRAVVEREDAPFPRPERAQALRDLRALEKRVERGSERPRDALRRDAVARRREPSLRSGGDRFVRRRRRRRRRRRPRRAATRRSTASSSPTRGTSRRPRRRRPPRRPPTPRTPPSTASAPPPRAAAPRRTRSLFSRRASSTARRSRQSSAPAPRSSPPRSASRPRARPPFSRAPPPRREPRPPTLRSSPGDPPPRPSARRGRRPARASTPQLWPPPPPRSPPPPRPRARSTRARAGRPLSRARAPS